MTEPIASGAIIMRNEDITEVVAEIPKGHFHLCTTPTLGDGSIVTLQEATVAAIVRTYVEVKTDPLWLTGRRLAERKSGYAEWQLVEES